MDSKQKRINLIKKNMYKNFETQLKFQNLRISNEKKHSLNIMEAL